jgi:glucokinase
MAETYILAGDVGGTNTRLSLCRLEGDTPVAERTEWLPSAGSTLEARVAEFLGKGPKVALQAAALAVPGPVLDGICHTTNLPWVLDEVALSKHIGTKVSLLNDLQAMAFGLLYVPDAQLETVHGSKPPRHGPAGVIAAGTGLGQALLAWDGARYHPCASEGSHAEFGPRNDLQVRLRAYVVKREGRCSAEHVCCGPGIGRIYDFLRQESGTPEPEAVTAKLASGDRNAHISELAASGADPIAAQAVDLFVEILGSEAGNLALRMVATGGIFIGGGIAPRLLPKLRAPAFWEAFCDKGSHRSLCERISVNVSMATDAGLLGASHFARLS